MFFTKYAKVLAHLLVWGSALQIINVYGYQIYWYSNAPTAETGHQVLSDPRYHEGLIAGLKYLMIGFALGIVAEASATFARLADKLS